MDIHTPWLLLSGVPGDITLTPISFCFESIIRLLCVFHPVLIPNKLGHDDCLFVKETHYLLVHFDRYETKNTSKTIYILQTILRSLANVCIPFVYVQYLPGHFFVGIAKSLHASISVRERKMFATFSNWSSCNPRYLSPGCSFMS